jgi:hypothetical protein
VTLARPRTVLLMVLVWARIRLALPYTRLPGHPGHPLSICDLCGDISRITTSRLKACRNPQHGTRRLAVSGDVACGRCRFNRSCGEEAVSVTLTQLQVSGAEWVVLACSRNHSTEAARV